MSSGDRGPTPGTGRGRAVVYTRRTAIGLGAAALAGAALATEAAPAAAGPTRAAQDGAGPDGAGEGATGLLDALRPDITPRDVWGADLPVTGTIEAEDDVRFLLVHHTASTNDYQPNDVVDQIRGFHRFHTGPEKGWPDVAYNFFVDRFGGVWEARQGSIDGPVRGDATGGSQGFALLCSLIGDHAAEPVTAAARSSLIDLLAWLAERHGIDTTPGATVGFVSRGSNRWAEGVEVTAASISGHRDMSQTSCPGDFGYDLVTGELPLAVSERRRQVRAAVATTAPAPTLVAPTPTPAPSTQAPRLPSTTQSTGPSSQDLAAGPGDGDGPLAGLDEVIVPAAVAGGVTAALALGAAARRRTRPDPG